MNEQQIEVFLQSFRTNLRARIIRIFALSILSFFILLIFIKFLIIYQHLNLRSQTEFAYLQRLGRTMVVRDDLQTNRTFLFLEATAELVESAAFTLSGQQQCNLAYFDCQNSRSDADYKAAASLYPLIQTNSQLLTNDSDVAAIFMFSSAQSTIYFSNEQLGLRQLALNYSLIDQFTNSNASFYKDGNYNEYLMVEAICQRNRYYQFICQALALPSIHILCVVSNKIEMDASKGNVLYRRTSLYKLPTGSKHLSFLDWIKQHAFLAVPVQTILACIDSSQKIQLQTDSNFYEGEGQICRASNNFGIFGIFGPFFAYNHFHLQFSKMAARASARVRSEPQTLKIDYYIGSNSSYNGDTMKIISVHSNEIRYMGYGVVVMVGLSLLLLSYPDELVENNIISSILEIHNLYEHLRNKEEKDFSQIYAKKRTVEFGFIADYLNKFMWVYKLIKSNKEKAKYKKLLKEGIELFEHSDFHVKTYIFKQLIRLEKKLIDSLLKVRQLPIKKKETHKLQFLQQAKLLHSQDKERPVLSKRRNLNTKLLNPDDDEAMKNISVSLKQNRGVRFSNDIQTVEIDSGPVLRKSLIAFIEARSYASIRADLSEADLESVKLNEGKDSTKSLKEDQESYNSLNELNRSRKKESSLRNRGLESIYADIQNMRLDQQESQIKQTLQEENLEEKQLFAMSREREAFAEEISSTYHRTIEYYDDLIKLKTHQAKHHRQDELVNSVNAIYQFTLDKYELIANMLAFENEMGLLTDEEQRDQIATFQDLLSLERRFTAIGRELLQQGEIVRMQVHQHLYLPVSFRNLQFLAKSQQIKVRVVARRLLAEMAEKVSPHLDGILMRNIFSLLDEKTSCSQKRNLLVLLTRTLERYYSVFTEEIAELKLARQFYNRRNKKIYFIVSILNPKPFAKFIDRLYEYIQPFDMVTVFNLEEEYAESVQADASELFIPKAKFKKISIEKVKFELKQQDFTEMFNFVQERVKETPEKQSSSTKTISKKKQYQKEFHEILSYIEADETVFSKYLFLLLGEQQNSYLGQPQESSSSGHKTGHQRLHQQITKIIDKGYYHIVLAGRQLRLYPSKYGKLKKYLQLSPELLEIELGDKEQEENYLILQKYLQ